MAEPKDYIFDKAEARAILKARRGGVDNRQNREASAASRLIPLLKGNVMLYASIGSELSADGVFASLIKRGIDVFMPFTTGGEIMPLRAKRLGERDGYGNLPSECYEDISAAEARRKRHEDKLDFCVVPLLGFNDSGYRIGYGKGCYDRFLKGRDVFTIGLAFDCQKINFTSEAHDIPLDCCVTESKVLYFDHARNFGKV